MRTLTLRCPARLAGLTSMASLRRRALGRRALGRRALALGLLALGLLALGSLAPRVASAAPRADRAGTGAPTDEGDPDDGGNGDEGREADPPPAASAPVAGPRVGEVLEAAYRAAGLDRDRSHGLSRRARLAGLVPSLTVRTGRNTSWQDADPQVDRGTTVEARATWRLDRLVFDGRELQAASMQAARGRERRQLASRVIRAYFHWQRTARAAAAAPRWASRAEEAAAELDALTDGWLSAELAHPRRRATVRAR